jgi:HK97 family phage prohead protease
METKDFALQVKAVGEEGTFEGYAATFGGAPDPYGDIITAGAFGPSLVRHRREGTMPLMLFGHDAGDLPIGSWTEMSEDGKGLLVNGTIALDDPVGVRVHAALKGKRVRGLSIGGRTKASRPDEKRPGVRFLDEFELFEVSVVNFPANRAARVHAVKSEPWFRLEELARRFRDAETIQIKEFEEVLRDAGFPKSAAVQIASAGWPKAIRSESEGKAKESAAFWEALRG